MHMGDMLAEMLIGYETEVVFGMPGGQTCGLYEGIGARRDRIDHVLVRDERNGVYAADAYARLTGKPGVCDVTVGPGATKLTDGFVEAMNASIPLIGIVGELPRDWAPLKAKGVASQGFDQLTFFKSISKEAFWVPTPESFQEIIRTAFRIATSPRPGPVAIIVPHDVMDHPWDPEAHPIMIDDRYIRAPSHRARALPDHLDAAARELAAAERPLIVAGGGVHASGAYDQLKELAHKTGAGIVTSLSGKGVIDEHDDMAMGVLNPMGSKAALDIAPEADLIFWIGSKASQNTANNWTLPTFEQSTIVLDDDPEEHGRTFRPTVSLFGDIRETLTELLPKVEKQERKAWKDQMDAVRDAQRDIIRADWENESLPIHPGRVLRKVAEKLTPEDIVISDASFSSGWIGQYLLAKSAGRHFLYARGQGSLGYSVPASLGAAKTKPDQRILTVAGDGGSSFYIGELATQAQHNMKVVNLIFNNGIIAWLKIWEQIYYNGLRMSVDLESNHAKPSYAAAAPGLGLKGILVESIDQIDAALDEAFAYDGPSVVEVRTDPDATPIHSLRRRLENPKPEVKRPGTVYKLRDWKVSPSLVKGDT
ncbi:MAG: thiamine pyrophosphate-binding protein [Jhaorihella sp.]